MERKENEKTEKSAVKRESSKKETSNIKASNIKASDIKASDIKASNTKASDTKVSSRGAHGKDAFPKEGVRRRGSAKKEGEFALQQLVDLSHDMRTPLSIILSTVQLLEDRAEEHYGTELEQIRRNAQQLLRIISNIVDLAAIDSGHVRLHMQQVECVSWLREVSLACAPYARHKGVEFTFASNAEELWITCDAVRLERCVLNLVSNAVRFTETGGLICLFIEASEHEVCISVSDNGCGMDEKQLTKLFKRFSATSVDTQQHKGNGLGLSLVKSFIERMGGRIEIESEYGEGTRASLHLPIRLKTTCPSAVLEVLGPAVTGAAVELSDILKPRED